MAQISLYAYFELYFDFRDLFVHFDMFHTGAQ